GRDGVVYWMSGYRGSAGGAIRLDASGDVTDTGKVLWSLTRGTPYVPAPALAGDRLVFTQMNDAQLSSVDVRTGKVILDRVRIPGLRTLYASPVAAAGRLYLTDRDGTTVVLRQADTLE